MQILPPCKYTASNLTGDTSVGVSRNTSTLWGTAWVCGECGLVNFHEALPCMECKENVLLVSGGHSRAEKPSILWRWRIPVQTV